VQVVLCGQPALLQTLKTDPMLALNERITRRVTLAPLGSSEVHAYIQHRLAIAGGMHSVTFGQDATRVVADLSRGLPRRINLLCDRALEEGRFEGVTVMTPDLVKRAARSVGLQEPPSIVPPEPAATVESTPPPSLLLGQISEPASPRSWVRAGAIAAIVAALGVGYWAYAWSTISGLGVPTVQPIERRTGSLAGPLAVPSDDEFRALLAPRTYVAPPAPPSAELPGNPNQLN